MIMVLSMGALAGCGASDDADSNTSTKEESGESSKKTENSTNEPENDTEFAYTLVVDGHEYSFPMTYEKLLELGWLAHGVDEGKLTMEEFGDFTIPAESSGCPFFGGLGGMDLGDIKDAKVLFDNSDGKTERVLKECPIVGIKFENDNGFPQGSIAVKSATGTVTIGESTEEDIQALFDGEYFYDEDDGFIFIDTNDQGIVTNITFTLK